MSKKILPEFIVPMMASIAKKPFDDSEWIFETKLDGYRAIAVIDSLGKARIWSRNRLPLEPKFPMVLNAVNQLKLRSTILDGEIVALDPEGIPRFQLLQQWQKRPIAPVVYSLFDLLWFDGRDLTGKTVLQRRERLQKIITQVDGIQVGGYIENSGKALFQLAKEKGLEGIIAKRKSSVSGRENAHRIGSKSSHDHRRNSLCAASPKVRAVESILALYFWEHTKTGSSATSGIPARGSARTD
jgi:bifunctional non-homologous end joining protein LigD